MPSRMLDTFGELVTQRPLSVPDRTPGPGGSARLSRGDGCVARRRVAGRSSDTSRRSIGRRLQTRNGLLASEV